MVTSLLTNLGTNPSPTSRYSHNYLQFKLPNFIMDSPSILALHGAFAADSANIDTEDNNLPAIAKIEDKRRSQQILPALDEKSTDSKKTTTDHEKQKILSEKLEGKDEAFSKESDYLRKADDRSKLENSQISKLTQMYKLRLNEITCSGNYNNDDIVNPSCPQEQYCKSAAYSKSDVCMQNSTPPRKDPIKAIARHEQLVQLDKSATSEESVKNKEPITEGSGSVAVPMNDRKSWYMERRIEDLKELKSGNGPSSGDSNNTSEGRREQERTNVTAQKREDSFTVSCSPDGIVMGMKATGLMTCVIHNDGPIPIVLKLTCSGLEGTGIQCFINEHSKTTTTVIEKVSTKTFSVVTIASSSVDNNRKKSYPFTISVN
jgi:hypothetical protein